MRLGLGLVVLLALGAATICWVRAWYVPDNEFRYYDVLGWVFMIVASLNAAIRGWWY